jgi:hypothetical protein
MVLTDTVHPPAGATALIASSDPAVRELGWWLLPIVVLSVVLMTGTGCVFGNVPFDLDFGRDSEKRGFWYGRRWPAYWWREGGGGDERGNDHGEGGRESREDGEGGMTEDVEKNAGTTSQHQGLENHRSIDGKENRTTRHIEGIGSYGRGAHVVVIPDKVITSEGLDLSDEEAEVLEALSRRLAY